MSIIVVLLTIILVSTLRLPPSSALVAAALVAVSPSLVESSATVGVDGIVTTLALLSTILALRIIDRPTLGAVIAAGIAAGCAVGTKYNAAPLVVLPLVAVVVARGAGIGAVAAALLTPCLAFLATTPFLLANIPLFLDHIAYEIWHYGIAGHEGHTGEPGLGQALFYANWFWGSALGVAASTLAVLGVGLMLLRGDKRYVLMLLFPALYLLLMISQKANFTRNMHLVIPYVACAAACTAGLLSRSFGRFQGAAAFALTLGLCAQPALWAIESRTQARAITESRITAAQWLQERHSEVPKTAVSGALQFEPGLYKLPGI
ncbi:MAG: phospholipid carrier-dependent glycosyltransferase, partial [Proteobacteria bacterium]|nr:phospholipid carrier-dependent glycosyltransferase [Pseudomonadota bacterium]